MVQVNKGASGAVTGRALVRVEPLLYCTKMKTLNVEVRVVALYAGTVTGGEKRELADLRMTT